MRKLQGFLDLHTSCNYRCDYCFRSVTPYEKSAQGPLPIDVFESIAPVLSSMCWSVNLSCAGEPLLHPQFEAVIEKANRRLSSCDVAIVTNGFELTESKQNALVGSIVSRIFISVDTIQPQLYSRLCGCSADTLKRVIANIESLAARRKKGCPPYIFITAIAMKSTLPHLAQLAEWVCNSGIDGLKIQWLIPFSSGARKEMAFYDRSTQDIFKTVEGILRPHHVFLDYPFVPVLEKIKSVISGATFIKNKPEYYLFSLNKFLKSRRKRGCRAAGTHLNIMQDGSMYVCPNNAGPVISSSLPLHEQEAAIKKAIKSLSDDVSFKECDSCRFSMENTLYPDNPS